LGPRKEVSISPILATRNLFKPRLARLPEVQGAALSRAGRSLENLAHDTMDKRSDVHLAAARCCKELYLSTQAHYHLEAGYNHYRDCVENMGAHLSTMFKLPLVLYEFASLLEHYGAMTAALETYSKILANFPNFRGYFDTMYRTAVVGKHLAEFVSKPADKEDMLNKCIDIFQFLLEAVPPTINEVNPSFLQNHFHSQPNSFNPKDRLSSLVCQVS
jgi:hypothetical protein